MQLSNTNLYSLGVQQLNNNTSTTVVQQAVFSTTFFRDLSAAVFYIMQCNKLFYQRILFICRKQKVSILAKLAKNSAESL